MTDQASTSTEERSAGPAGQPDRVGAPGAAYLRVECNVTRVVRIDGKNVGRTDELLELPPGEYTVTLLAPPHDFRPKYRRLALSETPPDKPTVVRFETR